MIFLKQSIIVIWTIPIILHLTVLVECQYYNDDYRVTDDVEDEDSDSYSDEPKRKDYTKYYASGGSIQTPGGLLNAEASNQASETGFVTPIDFTGLFTDTHFGLGLGASNVKNVFAHQPGGQSLHPFGLQESASTNNDTGFVSPNDFKSIFDIAVSASESAGFRAKDFLLPQSSDDTSSQLSQFFSTPFGSDASIGQLLKPSGSNSPASRYPSLTAIPPTEQYKKPNSAPTKIKKTIYPKKYRNDDDYSASEDYITPTSQSEYSDYESLTDLPSTGAFSTSTFTADYSDPTELTSTVEPHRGKSSYPTPTSLNILSAKTQYYPSQSVNSNNKYLVPSAVSTPYQKYSFQPSNYFDTIANSALPSKNPYTKFPTPTIASSNTDLAQARREDAERVPRKRCRKIEKHIPSTEFGRSSDRFRSQPMTCFVCKDAKSGETYEQCSYTSEPNKKEYYVGQKYSNNGNSGSPTTISSFRYKRYAEKSEHYESDEDEDKPRRSKKPKRKSYRYKSQPAEFASETYAAPDFSDFHGDEQETKEDHRIYDDPNYYSFDPIIESYSAQQSEQIKKDGGNCKKVERDSMTCMVCENPKTGGNFEQCSYTSKPKENKYAFTKETKYDSNDDPQKEEGTEQKPVYKTKKAPRRKFPREALHSDEVCEDIRKKSLLCTVCKNLKTGGKSEKCSYRSQPNPKKYAYRNERTYRNKPENYNPDDHEDHEDHEEDDEDTEQSQHRFVVAPSNKKYKRARKEESEDNEEEYDVPVHFEQATKNAHKDGIKPDGLGLDPDLYGKPDDEVDVHEEKGPHDHEKKGEGSENTKTYDETPSLNYDEYFAKIFPEYAAIKRSEIGEDGAASEHSEESHGFKNPEEFFAESSKTNVEEVLAEFAKKDRSNCKKVTKDKLTCYMCVDERGMKNEECMYVTESQPKSSHLAYHQVQKYRSVPEQINSSASQNVASNSSSTSPSASLDTEEPPQSKTKLNTKRKSKKKQPMKDDDESITYEPELLTTPYTLTPSDSNQSPTHVLKRSVTYDFDDENLTTVSNQPYKSDSSDTHYVYKKPPPRNLESSESRNEEQRTRKRNKNNEKNDTDEPELPTPVEFQVEGSDGAFASELKPVYSKRLGITLPAFMLTKSEHEASFDEAVASGK